MHVPVKLHEQLGRLKPLAQYSKNNLIPKNYTLLIGDSYVEGLGDWYMREINEVNPIYHAGHVLHKLSGNDVMSFGYRGGFPSYSIVTKTTQDYLSINKYAGIWIAHPSRVLVFFFEGNDFSDELAAIDRLNIVRSKLNNKKFVHEYISELRKAGVDSAQRRWHFLRNSHLIDTGMKFTKLIWKNLLRQQQTMFTPDDKLIAGYHALGKNYKENWERYRGANASIYVRGEKGAYPKETVEPIAFITPRQIKWVSNIYGATLRYLDSLFPKADIWTVYLPSPINAYQFISEAINIRNRDYKINKDLPTSPLHVSISAVRSKSDFACEEVRLATHNSGAKFMDTRLALQKVSSREGYIHGPNDPLHFNEKGYRALAEIIHRNLLEENSKSCDVLASKGGNKADINSRLSKLKKLEDAGLITKEEAAEKRKANSDNL